MTGSAAAPHPYPRAGAALATATLIAVAVAVATACGRPLGATGAPGDDARPHAADARPHAADAGPDAGPDGSPDAGGEPCQQAAAALASELHATPGRTCSLVARLDYTTRAPLGFAAFCGRYTRLTEDDAIAVAAQETGLEIGFALHPADPEDEFVFFRPPSDIGGPAVVSARNGLTLFGATTIFAGRGDIVYPTRWRPAADLATDCPPVGNDPPMRGYDLIPGRVGSLSHDDVAAAYAVVAQTAVPAAIWTGGYLFDVVVITYAREVEFPSTDTAEWIVIVNSGWLD